MTDKRKKVDRYWNDTEKEKPEYPEEGCPITTLSTTNFISIGLVSKVGLLNFVPNSELSFYLFWGCLNIYLCLLHKGSCSVVQHYTSCSTAGLPKYIKHIHLLITLINKYLFSHCHWNCMHCCWISFVTTAMRSHFFFQQSSKRPFVITILILKICRTKNLLVMASNICGWLQYCLVSKDDISLALIFTAD